MVTARGSNQFKGTFRVWFSRDFWGTNDREYPYRDGTWPTSYVKDDYLYNTMEFTLQGPIWKDHITFAYGGKIQPLENITKFASANNNVSVWSNPDAGPQSMDLVGLYYEDPTNGIVIRRAELRGFSSPYDTYQEKYWAEYNQFTLFGQINPNHQIEFFYRESDNDHLYLHDNMVELPEKGDKNPEKLWSVAYKGIIGSSGVLEMRHGKTKRWWIYNAGTTNDRPIHDISYASFLVPNNPNLFTYDGDWVVTNNYANYNENDYEATGWLDYFMNPSLGNFHYRTRRYGGTNDKSDGGGTQSTIVNYQHFLTTAMGNHIIDVGFGHDKLDWNLKSAYEAPTLRSLPRIPLDLRLEDIYNPRSVHINLADYAGKYPVYNYETATLGDLDTLNGYGLAKWAERMAQVGLTANTLLFNSAAAASFSVFIPRLEYTIVNDDGAAKGKLYTSQTSFYANDLWSINDHHSVMLGARVDMFKVWDAMNSNIHSYTKPTFRFEYKWDIYGDQSRLMNLSLSQFHNYQNGAIFAGFTNLVDATWIRGDWNQNEPETGRRGVYLVDYNELTNPDNYGWIRQNQRRGGDVGAIDPNWKSPTATEFALGFARNLSSGGSWKATFIRRTWEDKWDLYPGEIIQSSPGSTTLNQAQVVLKSTDEFERTYTSVELEWDVPITKHLMFGGNYTFARLMTNELLGSGTGIIRENNFNDQNYAMTSYWDEKFASMGGRSAWAPVLLKNSEHYLKFFFLCDLSLGKVKSNISFRGEWTSGSTRTDGISYVIGYPYIEGVMEYPGGGTGQNERRLRNYRNIPISVCTGSDIWYTTVRYHLEMPLIRKCAWFFTADIYNPFNHRGIGGRNWFNYSKDGISWPRGSGQTVTPDRLQTADGDYIPVGDNYNGIWRSTAGTNSTKELYIGRMAPRSVTLQTGLRF
jgi:hypothetical protein